MHKTLISPSTLAQHVNDPSWVIIDCRFDLTDPNKGESMYRAGHIPGARYAHLDRHLSGQKTGTNGRHPLPDTDALIRTFGELGIGPHVQVVAYDADSSMYAGRLWWMLRWLGHDAVAVLDGGLKKWRAEGRPVESGGTAPARRAFTARPRPELVRDIEAMRANVAGRTAQVLDARSAGRFAGTEPEPRAGLRGGHIPGSLNLPYETLYRGDGTLKPPDELRAAITAAGIDLARPVVTSCGSGVTASVLALALYVVGRQDVAVYDGSWSEWGARVDTPVET
jgi:thiosulfate/3-mercaptopyruvate sulfurtransferase